MSNFLHAMAQGLAGVADKGMGLLAEERQMQAKIEAEERAADRQLRNQERLEAVREMRANRAAEAFGKQYQGTAGMKVQKEAAPVTEFTQEGVREAGYQDGMQGNVNDLTKQMESVLTNPKATAEQKEHAQAILEQMGEQAKGQKVANEKAVAGQSRDASLNERLEAAVGRSLESGDGAAANYGSGLLDSLTKDEREEKKLRSQYEREELRQDRLDGRAAAQEAGRHERELERIKLQATEAQQTGNKQLANAAAISMRREVDNIDDRIKALNKQKVGKDPKFDKELVDSVDADIASLESRRKQYVDMERQYFAEGGLKLPPLPEDKPDAPEAKKLDAPEAKKLDALPAGAKKIGTKNGKDVYELPNGKRFIQE